MDTQEKRYDMYDEVVSKILVNLMIEHARNGELVLKSFNPEDETHKLMFEVAFIFATSIQTKVYLDMPWLKYIKFKLRNWSIRKIFEKYRKKNNIEMVPTEKILQFMKYDLDLEENIYGEIYREYYEEASKNRSIYRWKRKK